MRLYGFGNLYLSSIQQGIQLSHCLGEMIAKYDHNTPELKQLEQWSIHHKTIIALNGGNSYDLKRICSTFETKLNEYPFSDFREDENSLNNSITSVGIVVPAKIYECAAMIRGDADALEELQHEGTFVLEDMEVQSYNSFDVKLIALINSCRLAT